MGFGDTKGILMAGPVRDDWLYVTIVYIGVDLSVHHKHPQSWNPDKLS